MLREAAASDGSGLFIVRHSERTSSYVMSWIGGGEGKVTHTQVCKRPHTLSLSLSFFLSFFLLHCHLSLTLSLLDYTLRKDTMI